MNSIIDELKDRKVIRTVVSYAVVAFVIMQLVEIIFPIFDFPKWTAQFVIILLTLGLPAIVVFSWIFDRTPEGFVKAVSTSSSVNKTEDDTRPFYAKKQNAFLVAGVVGGLAIGWLVPRGDREAERIAERSIAVLPFDNLSDSKEDEYFSDGITEEIITQLSKVSELLVISRTSVLQYKGTTKTIREIGEELGVAAILEGSVRRDGDNLRITGQLIDTDNDQHLWADTYDRRMENIFQIQTDVATRIAEALDARISRLEKRSMATVPTQNVEAYTLYLKGKTEYFNYTYEGFEKSIDYYKQALKLDPSYALAYSGMGDSYGQMFLDNQDELYSELSIQSSEKALSINKDLAEGYKARALISSYLGRISEAIDMNKRAI
ncbi:MAG TPA: tetratricopeptide repeat protein, partial [Candidatus Marinimicrobia bacterium]|nr:tetratricopeptide repeat protein [Candidatus Neomarinimicrobiota bacterium]